MRGVELFVRRIGSGPPVVVLHGGPGAHHDYLLPGFDALADGRELIYYDQRGGGRSPVARDVPVGMDRARRRPRGAAARLGARPAHHRGLLLGRAAGAALRAGAFERVARLALVSPAPAWRAARERFEARFSQRNLDPAFQDERRALRESGLRERDPEVFQQRIFELSVAPYFHDPERARDLTPFRVTGRTQQEVWASLGDFDLRDRLPSLRGIPSLVLHGEADPIPIEAGRTAAELIGAEFHPVPRCGHVPYVEAHEEFVRVVGGFLAA